MSPSQREREYARRRYTEWQERHNQKQADRERRRRRAVAVAAALAVLLVVGGVSWLLAAGDDPEPAASGDPAATEPDPAAAEDNPCPPSSAAPPAGAPEPGPAPDPALAEGRTWTATLTTSCGPVTVELFGDRAPQAVASFLQLARDGFFAETPCHRLTTEGIFVLQCGDPTGTGTGGPGYTFGPIENAPTDDVYPAGTLAMARRGGDAASHGSQFFLVHEDSTIPSDAAGGYTVFGRVTDGLDVVQRVAEGGVAGGATDGEPARAISIEQVTIQ